MSCLFRFAAPLLCAATFTISCAANAAPLITAFIGTPSPTTNTAYFVLDFNDTGANPEVYNFGWHYDGNKTASDFIVALGTSLTGANGFQQTGGEVGFVTRMGYNGRALFNDFGGNNSGDPNGYWNLWLGFDGATWTNSQFGASSITLSGTPTFDASNKLTTASWTGWRWLRDFTTDTPAAPRTAQVAVVPEAGTFALLGVGCWVLSAARRKKAAA